MNILEDDRVQWLRQRVVLALDLKPEFFDEYFIETLERARSSGIARETLEKYLSSECGAGTALFFSAHQWTEDIESELRKHKN
jgi:hypothetical protein